MSESAARAKRRASRNGEKPDPESPPETAIEPGDVKQHAGVVILRVPVPDQPGQEQVQIIPINGMDPLAIPRLLELALIIDKQNAGIH